ncbi:MAG: tRNA 2-thiouridine(34) synthase MnmA [Elusimicrobia bacterium]|nr:tRNA 2-thiouridine(34) synthase MnmA [Elusimicrobiota bacterium]
MSRKRVVVAMSGGVDSSVAAALLVEQGYEVLGVTLRLLPKLNSGFGCCGSPSDIEDARRVCEGLGIAHYTMEAAKLFGEKVISPFVESYFSARTPNPCVECNRSIKFDYLMKLAKAWDADFLATGHYSKLTTRNSFYRLLKARDLQKDQSYFLYMLTQAELKHSLFPVGDMTKVEVREKARHLGLTTAGKPDSHEICFVPDGDYREFLRQHQVGEILPGPILDTEGVQVGTHRGLIHYTIGQKKGLGLGGREGQKVVVGMDANANALMVGGPGEVGCDHFFVSQVSWAGELPSEEASVPVEVKVRYRHAGYRAQVKKLSGNRAEVCLEVSQPPVTPGQSAVFYHGDEVLGGGIIE